MTVCICDKNNPNVKDDPVQPGLEVWTQQQWRGGWAEESLGIIKKIVLVIMSDCVM